MAATLTIAGDATYRFIWPGWPGVGIVAVAGLVLWLASRARWNPRRVDFGADLVKRRQNFCWGRPGLRWAGRGCGLLVQVDPQRCAWRSMQGSHHAVTWTRLYGPFRPTILSALQITVAGLGVREAQRCSLLGHLDLGGGGARSGGASC